MAVPTLPAEIAKEFEAAVDDLKRALSAPLAYKVTYKKTITMRGQPSVYAAETGRLSPGDIVKGYPAGPWLFVVHHSGPLPSDGAWVLIDGTPLGVGNLLRPEWAHTSLEAAAGKLYVRWPGIIGESTCVYYVQWKPDYDVAGNAGGTVIAMQSKQTQEVTAVISGIVSGTKVNVRVVASLSCGLLVGPWNTTTLSSDEETVAVSKTYAVDVPADVLLDESKRYTALAQRISAHGKSERANSREDLAFSEEIAKLYKERPKDCESAKEMVLSALFGSPAAPATGIEGNSDSKQKDMFGEATDLYEEGLAGECNRTLAEIIATLVRKHG